jgi:hypothetical protein
MSKLDSYPPGFQNRVLTSVYKRFVTGAHNYVAILEFGESRACIKL